MSTERREIMIASPYHKTAREELNTRMKTRLKPKMRLMEHKGPLCAVHIVLVAARMRLQFRKALLALFYCGFAGGHKSSRKKGQHRSKYHNDMMPMCTKLHQPDEIERRGRERNCITVWPALAVRLH